MIIPWKANKKHIVEISRDDYFTKGNLLDYLYDQNYHKFIGTDLSWQKNTSLFQQTNFVGNLEDDDGATMVFIAK